MAFKGIKWYYPWARSRGHAYLGTSRHPYVVGNFYSAAKGWEIRKGCAGGWVEGDVSVNHSKWVFWGPKDPWYPGNLLWELVSEGRELSPADWKPLGLESSEPQVH